MTDTQPDTKKRADHLSTDGKWRSFPKVPHLLQYVSNGNYYGRIKIGGKIIRESLNTSVWTTAKLRLTDFLKECRENRNQAPAPTFEEAVELYRQQLDAEIRIKERSKEYRERCLNKIQKTWPSLWGLRLDEITPQACKDWGAELSDMIAQQYFNNALGTFKAVLQVGIKAHKAATGKMLENPAADLKRVRVKQKELQLPEPSQFKDLVANIRRKSGGWGPKIATLIEFLAYGGMRIHSEAIWVTWEDVDWERKQIIVRGHPETSTKNNEIRRVPILPDMDRLLTDLKGKLGTLAVGRILKISRCDDALTRACNEIGVQRFTHHDLRHLFATRCIESGVDIPTVSKWLGHKDGGALAMKTYGHLRNEHSQAMAQKVKF
jgi:integrase